MGTANHLTHRANARGSPDAIWHEEYHDLSACERHLMPGHPAGGLESPSYGMSGSKLA